ncbi:hypothetical protein PoB_005928100 [Plakobranchus ocellatus]|uniref:Uncharacterized protein n=1 Tax=Plakobranchus ocellatus TaxID=259542 RepID=A0AAV4CLX2_9GAST|nr:hypothetical protein PoB_005928100 [Plakobranchus ocellatus]
MKTVMTGHKVGRNDGDDSDDVSDANHHETRDNKEVEEENHDDEDDDDDNGPSTFPLHFLLRLRMLLRSGRRLIRPVRPKMREANQSYHGHYVPLIKVRRCKREAKSLGLLDPYGQMNFQFQHPEPLPQNADEPVYGDLDERYCRASVYNRKEGDRQCRRRPKRDSDFCHSHDPRYRTNKTARRMRLLAEWRQEQLDAIIARRRRERDMEADARRGIVNGPTAEQIRQEMDQRDRQMSIRHDMNTSFLGGRFLPSRGVGGTVASESALRHPGVPLSRVRAPPPAPWPDGGPESLRTPC